MNIKEILFGSRRVVADILLFMSTILFFVLHEYGNFPAPIQLLVLKAMLVSAGILHAHLARKLLFPKVDWQADKFKGTHYVAIAFYIIIIYSYAIGG